MPRSPRAQTCWCGSSQIVCCCHSSVWINHSSIRVHVCINQQSWFSDLAPQAALLKASVFATVYQHLDALLSTDDDFLWQRCSSARISCSGKGSVMGYSRDQWSASYFLVQNLRISCKGRLRTSRTWRENAESAPHAQLSAEMQVMQLLLFQAQGRVIEQCAQGFSAIKTLMSKQ